VLAQVRPGELTAKLPESAPEQPETFADVLHDMDELLLPALTNWQSPRFFSYFAVTSSEPAILAGVEANIRASGEVDVADEDLALLDWVVASVHQAPDSRPTERVLEAMQNPYVDAVGHLTGRRIGKRPPRDVNVERVIEGALETGTLLEINGQPDRLDLRDVHARAAKEAGLKLILSSDAHEVRSQAYVELAVAQARRGWLTKADVANTRTWKQLDKLRKKRP
jgi:DNA polymerase (family X)